MTVTVFRKIIVFATPIFLIIFSRLAIPYIAGLPPAKYELALATPYLISFIGMFMAANFRRGRPFFALVLIITGYWTCRTYLPTGIQGIEGKSIFNTLSLFIPFNILLLAAMREKGLFSAAGRIRMVFFALQALIALILHDNHHLADLPNIFHSPLLAGIFDRITFAQIPLLAFVFELIAVMAIAIIRQAPVDSGLFGAMISFFIAGNWLTTPNMLVVFSSSAAIIVTVSILQDFYNMAFRDELTNVPSRRALNEQLHGIGRNYALAMVDIDHFKKFNDTYGHDIGDQVLKLVAKKLQNVTGGGKVYRYGGEEFTILFPRKNAEETLEHLESIRKEIAEYPLVIRNSDRPKNKRQGKQNRGRVDGGITTNVTVSIGVADSNGGEISKHEVIKTADNALYKAKNRGRNQVCK
ncbi:diguanylate cyclase VdcA [Geobacter sp. OR-1]|uniref:GGDEF domain-containing protein n=1 Tax=Geobacter sp. OR-1 TaxID=1266765 RepID=UPI0005428390|nr:GGDEF domain-containing protein [Geobacter sp. OR-1]GAM10743.1 diguanylate cyclase VdcA [Geobacter sp. OR-1]